jgi:hypothetical protein
MGPILMSGMLDNMPSMFGDKFWNHALPPGEQSQENLASQDGLAT